MEQVLELVPESVELPTPSTRPSTGSSFHSGVTSPSGSSEDEFFDAPEILLSQGTARSESPTEPRISTPNISDDISPTIEPPDTQPPDELTPRPFHFYPTARDVLEQLNGNRHDFPVSGDRDDELISLESIESNSETETITPGNIPLNPYGREDELEPCNLVEETTIPGTNGSTTNILTFHSPNPSSVEEQFLFRLSDKPQDPILTSPTADSQRTEEAPEDLSLTPTSDHSASHTPVHSDIRPQPQMQASLLHNAMLPLITNAQRLYPELEGFGTPPSPPCPLPLENPQEISFSPLPPPPPLRPSIPLLMEMELNPLYNPESIASEQLMFGAMHPAAANLVMHPLNQQMLLAQQQVLGAHLNSRMPHVALNHQLHHNNSFPANFIPGFHPSFSSPQHFPLPTQPPNTFELQTNTREYSNGYLSENDEDLAEWRRDLKLKEKRILREKFGNNHPELVTEEKCNRYLPHSSENETVEMENQFPFQEPDFLARFSPTESDQEQIHRQEDSGTEGRDSEEPVEETEPGKISYPSLPLTSSDEESSFLRSSEAVHREDVSEIIPGFISRKQNLRAPKLNPENSIIPPSEVGCTSPPFLSPLSSPFDRDSYPSNPELAETHPIIERETTVRFNITTFSHEEQLTPPPHSQSAPNLNTCSPPSAEFTWTRTRAILYPPPELSPAPTQLPIRLISRPPHSSQPEPAQEREIKRPPNVDANASSDSSRTTPSPYKPVKREISYPPGSEPGTSPKKHIVYPRSAEQAAERRICYPPPREIKRPPVPHSPGSLQQSFKHSSSYVIDREILYPLALEEPILPPLRTTPSREIRYPPIPIEDPALPSEDEVVDEFEKTSEVHSDENLFESIPRSPSPIEDIPGEKDDLPNDCPRESTPKKKSTQNEKLSDTESDVGGFQSATEID